MVRQSCLGCRGHAHCLQIVAPQMSSCPVRAKYLSLGCVMCHGSDIHGLLVLHEGSMLVLHAPMLQAWSSRPQISQSGMGRFTAQFRILICSHPECH